VRSPKPAFSISDDGFALEHRYLRSPKPYARGGVAEALSQNGDGAPPYNYDLFAAHLTLRKSSYLLLGFPFASLAIDIARDVLGPVPRSPFGEFSRVDVPRLVRLMEDPSEHESGPIMTSVVGVQVSVRDDRSLTAVRLGGDDPLGAELYRKYLKPKITAGDVVPDYCVMACEHDVDGTTGSAGRTIRSRVHIDRHGNFKFYVHVGCSNLRLIGSLLARLDTLHCLSRAERNPLLRVTADEDETLTA
jgi:hypothetical protein